MLRVNNLSYTYPEREKPALSNISLNITRGECICVTGHSGCGKSTLLLAIKGLLHEGILTGEIHFNGNKRTREALLAGLGLVFQNPESQLLCATVFDEVAFGPENLCLPPSEINRRIVESLTSVDLLGFGNRNVERFSAGQKQRLSIASILSMRPDVILLDEPTSQLDRKGKDDLCAVLRQLKEQGITILIAEHNIEPFTGLIDRYYQISGGVLTDVLDTPPEPYRFCPLLRVPRDTRQKTPFPATPAISAEGLSVSYQSSGTILDNITFFVETGELVHIYGENGCGKSTLLKTIAGVLPPDAGKLQVQGRDFPRAGGLLGTVALLLQNPQRQLFEDTVREEVAFTLKRLKLHPEDIDARVNSALAACEATHLADRLPLTLSFGEQHRVALASIIAPDPKVLLLDEPFAGLDPEQRLRLLQILASIRSERGTAVVIASHDPLPDPDWADRIMVMENGRFARGEAHNP